MIFSRPDPCSVDFGREAPNFRFVNFAGAIRRDKGEAKGDRQNSDQNVSKKGDKMLFSKGDRNRKMTYPLLPPPLIACGTLLYGFLWVDVSAWFLPLQQAPKHPPKQKTQITRRFLRENAPQISAETFSWQ